MGRRDHSASRALVALAVISAVWLIFNMIALLLHRDEVFLRPDSISVAEAVMMAGFLLILTFNIISIIWLLISRERFQDRRTIHAALLALDIFCIALLFADKVMVDEIGREMRLGWETLGEWIILYGLLSAQLVYNTIFILQAHHHTNTREGENVSERIPRQIAQAGR